MAIMEVTKEQRDAALRAASEWVKSCTEYEKRHMLPPDPQRRNHTHLVTCTTTYPSMACALAETKDYVGGRCKVNAQQRSHFVDLQFEVAEEDVPRLLACLNANPEIGIVKDTQIPQPPMENVGYHTTTIPKGELGQLSKVQEELLEAIDAEAQGVKVMVHVELADVYGALEAVAERYGLTMEDLRAMSDVTKRAFRSGERQ